MKNLKIRAKILLSFGIIVALILAAFAYVISMNVAISEHSEKMQSEFHLVELFGQLKDYSYQVNAGLQVISISLDDAIYADIVQNIDLSRAKLSEARAYISEHSFLSEFAGDLNALEPIIESWSNELNQLNSINREIGELIGRAQENQTALTSMSMDIFDYQMELALEEPDEEMSEAARRHLEIERRHRINRIAQGTDVANRLNTVGSSFEVMFKSLDVSNFDENMVYFSETVNELNRFRRESSFAYELDTAITMLDALKIYEADINEFIERLDERSRLIESGMQEASAVIDVVDRLVDGVNALTLISAEDVVESNNTTLAIIIIVAVVTLAASVFFAFYLSHIISSPITMISSFMRKAGTRGDITFRPDELAAIDRLSKQRDELGQLTQSTNAFVKHITALSKQLELLAGGDLTAQLDVLSDQDVIGTSVKNLVDSLNGVFVEINKATAQVANGSKQIADGAQSLAQGSTEQAATIEELSSSVTDIASKTGTNAEMASKAANLAHTIMDNAEKGSRQMDDMMAAVKDINDASQSIVNVIKVIEDIAFQTNILALNAAVEAARAGQHGKGFAVVAEEVRNLATKSSAAAKETENLIANSSDKAQLGSRIANETSLSLSQIVDGIRESSRLVSEIAESSNKQTEEISLINSAIDQVAVVVQRNSATAQQSAAASQEMSSQSIMLEGLVEQFKLKSEGNRRLPEHL